MAQLVSDFIINPVLRQARRFSTGLVANEPPAPERPALQHRRTRSDGTSDAAGTAILEGDESPGPLTGDPVPDSSAAAPHAPLPQNHPERDLHTRANPTIARPNSHANIETNTAPDTPAPAAWPPQEGNRGTPLPEDDGMGDLRRRIQAIQLLNAGQDAKGQMLHDLFNERYTRLHPSPRIPEAAVRPVSRSSTSTLDTREPSEHIGPLGVLKRWNPLGDGSSQLNLPLTEGDLRPTYFVPNKSPSGEEQWWVVAEQPEEEERRLGCEHYRRNVKLQCAECERWYTCRHCHDAVEDHVLPRRQTKHMLCMLCGCAQKASDTCTKCGHSSAYYCGICKLWNDDPNKYMYHCSGCGLCRIGQGLGKDFFHCKKCMTCIPMSNANSHKCVERAVDSNCPICREYLLDSPRTVSIMQCGHSIHLSCFDELRKTSPRCPLCNKSCVNMEHYFREVDRAILQQPMPREEADTRSVISCNDCSAKSQTAFHYLGLKCSVCNSYNTTELQRLKPGDVYSWQQEHPSSPQRLGQQQQQQPVALDPALVEEEIRRRNRAARRQLERDANSNNGNGNNNSSSQGGFIGLLSTSPSYSAAFISRFLNRGASSEPEQPSSSPPSTSAGPTSPSANTRAAPPPCDSHSSDSEDDDEEDMLDLFGAHNRDLFDRFTGLTSAESAVGLDDDDDEDDEEDEEDEESSEDGDGDGEEDDDDEEEEEDDDILLVGHR